MKNIILQHWTGSLGELELLSMQNIMAYAEFCGAEHRLLQGDVFKPGLSAPCQKIHMLNEQFDEYDYVVMMDIDMFTRKGMTKNIFTYEKGMGRHHGIQKTLVEKLHQRFPMLGDPKYPYWGGSIYKLPREIRQRLRRHLQDHEVVQFSNNFEDEGIMHRLAVLEQLPVDEYTYMDRQQWNHSSFDSGVEDANIIHIRPKSAVGGPKRPKIENYRELVKRGII